MSSLSPDAVAIIKAIEAEAKKTQAKFSEIENKYEQILCGFPNGDPDAHRISHQNAIERQKLCNEILRGALVRMGQGGVIAFVGAMIWLAWSIIKMELQK